MNILALIRDQLARNRQGLIRRLSEHSDRQPRRVDQEVGCLLWLGRKNNDAYPRMNFVFEGRHVTVYVHHVTHALSTGKRVPDGHQRDHICATRHCIEPRHIEIVTPKEHARRTKERRFGKWNYADAVKKMDEQRE